jgi:hypothetical protein
MLAIYLLKCFFFPMIRGDMKVVLNERLLLTGAKLGKLAVLRILVSAVY